MIISHLILKNWRNFQSVDIPFRERTFLVGPNASGKSNLLDVFRFLRDIAKTGGGLQKAVQDRGGLSKIRSLAARRDPEIEIEVHMKDPDSETEWRYSLGIKQETRGYRHPLLAYEKVWRNGELLVNRPDAEDKSDRARLTQTHLEQINTNKKFREIARLFQNITYLHLVPQLLRYADDFQSHRLENDPFGQGFLERLAKTPERIRKSRLTKIEKALCAAVPQLKKLQFERDKKNGRPHLEALYEHWRPNAGWQREDQFSDGTMRLIGLLWSLLEGGSVLLLEEPELSLNSEIVSKLAPIFYRIQRQNNVQILISTHSFDLLTDQGIDPQEVLLLRPIKEGTDVQVAVTIKQIKLMLEGGMSVGDAVLPLSKPKNLEQLELFARE